MNIRLRSTAHRLLLAVGVASTIVVAAPAAAAATSVVPSVQSTAPAAVNVPAAAAAVPKGFVRHTSRYWTWFGPVGWHASYSAYGLTVTSPAGSASWDYGASSTLCVAAPSWPVSAARYFTARRAGVVRGAHAASWKWLSHSKIATIGTRSYRQVSTFDATIGRNTFRGKITLIYSDNGGGYCYQSSDARVVVKYKYAATIGTLDNIARNTYYLAPGVCNPTLFDPRKC